MLKNFFKTSFRNLWKNKSYSVLNITGLAIGIASAALIFLWVEDELGYDHQFENKNYLYKIFENQTHDGQVATFRATPGPLANALQAEIPGIKKVARLSFNSNLRQLFALGDKFINEQGYYADSTIFSMLTLPFVYGNATNAFRQLHSLVISESMAKKFFYDSNPVGKTIKVNNEQDYIVTGVFRDLPKNSTFQFQWLAPFEIFKAKNAWLDGWNNNGLHTLVELMPGTNPLNVNKQLVVFLGSKAKDLANVQCFLFSMNDWHLFNNFANGKENGGEIKYVKLFSLIAGIILFIACINFMNLATARSEKRGKEVGVRKVMGAGKTKLISQFMGESLIMSFLAVFLAIILVYILLPGFNSLVGKQLSLNILDPLHIGSLIAIGLITGLMAGSYPAFYLSSFNPVMVLKGLKIKANTGAGFIRKGLVIVQFAVSIILIICTAIIYQQVQHTRQRDIGVNKNNLIYLDLQGQLKDQFDAVRNDLISTGVVENAALSDAPLLQVWSNADGFSWEGKDPNKHILISMENVSPQFISTMGMKLLKGRDFYSIQKVDSSNIIISESLAKLMGNEGRLIKITAPWGQNYRVVGIVKDFVFDNMYTESGPVVLFCSPANTNFLTIRIKKDADLAKALAKTETIIKTNNPNYPFEYKFVDDDFDQLFKTETLIGKLAGVFAALAIFISCLGLFGLASYTAERRTKEIGIRKVLGASPSGLAGLLSKEFLQLVALSCMIAFPIAWWVMNNWLQDYQYRAAIHWWIFGMAGISALFIALITVSFQAIKVALANPVKSLRTE